ncbi:hypothetical protein C8R44DRAFT_985495 [Mycena epipterygia]|nr:hypothetical protein C8R44DRAFT_985495 [Mycena epipterygia]
MSGPVVPYLRILPMEVWLACWTLCSTRQLRRLSLVCHLFRSLCLPFLFQKVNIYAGTLSQRLDPKDWMERLHRMHRTAVRLENIADSPYILMVQSLTFADGSHAFGRRSLSECYPEITHIGLLDTVYTRVVTTFFNTLGRYQHLRSMDLRWCTIDRSFRDTLASLSMLEDLTLTNGDITARDGAALNLKCLTMSNIGVRRDHDLPEEPLELLSPFQLHTLNLDGNGDALQLIIGLQHQILPHLTHLSVDTVSDVELFLRFLKQCPRLKSLAIKTFPRNGLPPLPMHPHANTTPHLQRIAAPLQLVRSLTPNRPLFDVTISRSNTGSMSVENFKLVLLDVSTASVPVQSLVIPRTCVNLGSMSALAPLLSDLQTLSIEIECHEQWSGVCGGVHRGIRPTLLVDTRTPRLCDEEAFDALPDEEISDAEEDTEEAPSPAVRVQSGAHSEISNSSQLHKVINWIVDGLVSLPADIEVFRLLVPWSSKATEMALEHQHQIVDALSRMYPSLREVELGSHNNPHWERKGALWKRMGVNEYLEVNLT